MREAIRTARVRPGMMREQVIMALGYPVTSKNPNLDARVWRYWLESFVAYRVMCDQNGRVEKVLGDDDAVELVLTP